MAILIYKLDVSIIFIQISDNAHTQPQRNKYQQPLLLSQVSFFAIVLAFFESTRILVWQMLNISTSEQFCAIWFLVIFCFFCFLGNFHRVLVQYLGVNQQFGCSFLYIFHEMMQKLAKKRKKVKKTILTSKRAAWHLLPGPNIQQQMILTQNLLEVFTFEKTSEI